MEERIPEPLKKLVFHRVFFSDRSSGFVTLAGLEHLVCVVVARHVESVNEIVDLLQLADGLPGAIVALEALPLHQALCFFPLSPTADDVFDFVLRLENRHYCEST